MSEADENAYRDAVDRVNRLTDREIEALVARLRGIAVCEPSPEPADTMRESAEALSRLTAELARATELHRHDRQMWDATRRRAEAAEAIALTAEAALATMKQEHEALSQIAAVAIAERDRWRQAAESAMKALAEEDDEARAFEARALTAEASLAKAVEALPFIRDPKTQHAFEIMTDAIRARAKGENA